MEFRRRNRRRSLPVKGSRVDSPLDHHSSTREKELSVIQKEIQAIIRQITASMTFLPLLDEPC